MIKHVVMWRMKDFALEKNGEENREEMKQRLEELEQKIPFLQSIEVGINIKPSPRAYDIVLVSTFDNLDDLESYRIHKDHQKVVDFIGMVTECVVAVDYEI